MTSTLYLHLIQKMKLSLSSLVAHSELKAAPFALLMKPLLFLTLPQPLSHCCPILYPGTLSAIQPTFSDGVNLFLLQAKCFGQFYLEKVSQLVVILRITGNRKTTLWFESLETRIFATTKLRITIHRTQILHFKRQLAIFMKILRYNPSGEIYGAENNLEALRLQHLQ